MVDNPFSALLNIMREEGKHNISSSFYLGKVRKLYEIETSGIVLYSKDLYLNPEANIEVGDNVLLVKIDEKFLIVCKVVAP